jgi:hypothetical protein
MSQISLYWTGDWGLGTGDWGRSRGAGSREQGEVNNPITSHQDPYKSIRFESEVKAGNWGFSTVLFFDDH